MRVRVRRMFVKFFQCHIAYAVASGVAYAVAYEAAYAIAYA